MRATPAAAGVHNSPSTAGRSPSGDTKLRATTTSPIPLSTHSAATARHDTTVTSRPANTRATTHAAESTAPSAGTGA